MKGLSQPTTVTVVASAARTSSSNSGNLKGTTGAIPYGDSVTLMLDVTANTGNDAGTNGTSIFLDGSPDGGTTWFPMLKFAAITGSTGQQLLSFRNTGLGPSQAAALTAAVTTTSTTYALDSVIPIDHRVRWIMGSDPSGGSITFALFAAVQPAGTSSR